MNIEELLSDPEVNVLNSSAGIHMGPVKKKNIVPKPVVEYDLDGVFIENYNTVKEASIKTGMHSSTISNICRGKFLHTKGLKGDIRIFLYRGDDISKRLQKIKERKDKWKFPPSAKEVCEYTLGGKFLFKHPTIKQAAIINKVTTNLIINCCKGKRLYIGKRILLYPDGDIKQRVKLVKAELYRLSQKRPRYRPVDAYTLEGEFIKDYPSASAASRDLNVHVSDITRCCNGINGRGHNCFTAKGKIFLWVGDSISDRLEQIELKNKRKVKNVE
jgi:hypothetical protein